ncbi:hypothetical protein GQ457_13G027390 [Hibiscus cannabinus]
MSREPTVSVSRENSSEAEVIPVPLIVTEEHSGPVTTSEDHDEQQYDGYEETVQNEQGALVATNSHDTSTFVPVETRSVALDEHAGLVTQVEHDGPTRLEPASEGISLQPPPVTAPDEYVATAEPIAETEPLTFDNNFVSEFQQGTASDTGESSHSNKHPMITRSKQGIFKPKVYLMSVDNVPQNIYEAMEQAEWRKAVMDEYTALIANVLQIRVCLLSPFVLTEFFAILSSEPLQHHEAYEGVEFRYEQGHFLKLKMLSLRCLYELKKLVIEEGALPCLEIFEIGPAPQLPEVPTNISNLGCLQVLKFVDMPKKFVHKLLPGEGPDHWKVKHIPDVRVAYTNRRFHGETYKLGDSRLHEHFQIELTTWSAPQSWTASGCLMRKRRQLPHTFWN